MSSIQTIRTALATAYGQITLPNGLGTPTTLNRQLDSTPSALPFVEIYRNPAEAIAYPDNDGYIVTRTFFARLYISKTESDVPSVTATDLDNADDCVETIEDYFAFTDDRLGRTTGVWDHRIARDTAATRLVPNNNDTYIGVVFEHTVQYIRERS